MADDRIRIRHLAMAGILTLGLGLRLAELGAAPLSDSEAAQALWAVAGAVPTAYGQPVPASAPESAVVHIATWAVFQVLPASDGAARIFPALIGASLILAPWFLRRRLGTTGALTAAFLLAVSPTLVSVSRAAGGASLAMACAILGLVSLVLIEEGDLSPSHGRWALAACLGLGVGSGAGFFHGFLIVLLGALALRGKVGRTTLPGLQRTREAARSALFPAALLALGLALAAGLTSGGLAAPAEGLRSWFTGWLSPGEVHVLTPLVALVVYEPAVLVLGLIGLAGASRRGSQMLVAAGGLAGLALLLSVVYPGRSGENVAWVAVFLAIPAGIEAAESVLRWVHGSDRWPGLGFAGLVVVLWAYASLQLAAYVSGIGPGVNPLAPEARLAVAAGAVVVGMLATVLIGFGWSWQVVRQGGGLAGLLILGMMTISAGSRLNHSDSPGRARELWQASAPTLGVRRLADTIEAISRSARGVPNGLEIEVEPLDLPASLAWALRAVPRFSSRDSGPPEAPPLVLRRQALEQVSLPGEYLGQTLILGERWDFTGPIPSDFGGWLYQRRIPLNPSTWVLYVRSDLATLGEAESGPP